MCLSTHTPGLNPSLTSGRLNQLLLSQINLVILYQVQSKCSEIEIASNLAKRKLSMCLCLRQNYDPNAWSEGQDFLHITIHHISSIPFLHCSLFPHIYNVFYLFEDKMVLVFNLQKAEIPIYMPFTSKGVPFEDQNYFINRISH